MIAVEKYWAEIDAAKELKEATLAATIKEAKFNAGVEAAAKFNAGVEAADLKEDETIDEYTLSEKDLLGRAAIAAANRYKCRGDQGGSDELN